ncbi:hypothetical protein LCGC14_0667040 [marine sediment metagenome]|uniref:PnuC protein n=1 Tax=marine sediment metagenome TaxID=412755 RepID=A0A0F9RC37_9ZZZZ
MIVKFNPFDFIGATLILVSLFNVSKHRKWWLVYALGCSIWIVLSISVGFYFGAIMNIVAVIISIKNWRRGK